MHAKSSKFKCKYITFIILYSFIFLVLLFHLFADDIPEQGQTIQELIESRGFLHETHYIKSQDGYILQVIRIVNPNTPNLFKLQPVLLVHGFQCSGSLWLVARNGYLQSDGKYYEKLSNGEMVEDGENAVGNSLGFVLANRGYDVWLGNYRGNIYSTNHTVLNADDEQFWKFSIDEQIQYDYPALIDYIRRETGKPSIGYIGHSQGNFMMFSFLATQPQYSSQIKPFIALSPVVYTSNFKALLVIFKPFKTQLLWLFPRKIFTNFSRYLLLPNLCANSILKYSICNLIYYAISGSQRSQIAFERLPIYLDNIFLGSSTNNLVHFLQMFDHGNPTFFDYKNATLNNEKYMQNSPLAYDMSQVNSTDIALIYTKNDWFNMMEDVKLLKNKLTVTLLDDYAVSKSWNHMDLVWSKEVGKVVNKRILQLLEKYN